MKIYFILQLIILVAIAPVAAQQKISITEQEAAYTKTITQRAEKIVTALDIKDASKAGRIRDLIANQYRSLNNIHSSRDKEIKSFAAKSGEKESLQAQIKLADSNANDSLSKLHSRYLAGLSSLLSPQQVEQVKDGMTYGVVPITYKGYMSMLPDLTQLQKDQILAWLKEAREHAMDAETSEKKHGWFGKYKGKINNYLSAAGYDMKKAGEDWQKRLKAEQETSKKQ